MTNKNLMVEKISNQLLQQIRFYPEWRILNLRDYIVTNINKYVTITYDNDMLFTITRKISVPIFKVTRQIKPVTHE